MYTPPPPPPPPPPRIPQPIPMYTNNIMYFDVYPRDRLTKDDQIGTIHLPMSQISGQGDDGNVIFLHFVEVNFKRDKITFPFKQATFAVVLYCILLGDAMCDTFK